MIYGEILGHLEGMDFVPFGVPNGAWELPIYLLLSVAVGSVLFNLLKGKYGIALIFFMVPGIGLIISSICAIRLAKPRSAWAAWLYDRKTMERSIARYEPPIDLEKIPPPKLRRGYTAPPEPASSGE